MDHMNLCDMEDVVRGKEYTKAIMTAVSLSSTGN